MEEGINNNSTYKFIRYNTGIDSRYYSGSDAKKYIDEWYKKYIAESGYESRVADGNYFCQEDKKFKTSMYKLSFKCATDSNGYGLLKSNIGLLSLDEAIYAGYRFVSSPISGPTYNGTTDNYLSSQNTSWLISSGFSIQTSIIQCSLQNSYTLRPVINLNSNVKVTGTGTISNPYVIQ